MLQKSVASMSKIVDLYFLETTLSDEEGWFGKVLGVSLSSKILMMFTKTSNIPVIVPRSNLPTSCGAVGACGDWAGACGDWAGSCGEIVANDLVRLNIFFFNSM